MQTLASQLQRPLSSHTLTGTHAWDQGGRQTGWAVAPFGPSQALQQSGTWGEGCWLPHGTAGVLGGYKSKVAHLTTPRTEPHGAMSHPSQLRGREPHGAISHPSQLPSWSHTGPCHTHHDSLVGASPQTALLVCPGSGLHCLWELCLRRPYRVHTGSAFQNKLLDYPRQDLASDLLESQNLGL